MSDLWHRVPEMTLCHHLGTQTGEAIQRGRRVQMRLPRVRPGPNTVFEVTLAGDEHFWRVPGVRRAPVVLTETAWTRYDEPGASVNEGRLRLNVHPPADCLM